MNNSFSRMPSETLDEYLYRMFILRESLGYTWVEFSSILNENTCLNLTPDGWRKRSYKIFSEFENIEELDYNIFQDVELRKEKVRQSDEKNQVNSLIRRLAREDTIKDIAISVAEKFNSIKSLDLIGVEHKPIYSSEAVKEGLLEISDWHYGLEIDNHFNKYNVLIARDRVQKLTEEVISYGIENNISKLHVLNLGDLISGRIHLQLRINSQIDVITQIIEVSELLASMLVELSHYFKVEYYSTTDNHSRIEPVKENSLDLESLSRITDWFLKERVGKIVTIHANNFSDDIAIFNVLGYNILGVHGDKDKPSKVIDNMTLLTKSSYDLMCTAHLHHFSANEQNETLLISNGSLMGTDEYAFKLRLSSKASQNLIICSEKNVCESLYRIVLN